MMYNKEKREGGGGIHTQIMQSIQGQTREKWLALLAKAELEPDGDPERTVLIWDEDTIIATGSRQGNLLKCIAVDPARQGEDLTATVLTALRQDAFAAGHKHLFLYTKPKNRYLFQSLFFHPIAQTQKVLLMEDQPRGIQSFLDTLPPAVNADKIGALVMNCNPFTKGHQYLVETAARDCDQVYVFVLSEDKSRFSAADRMEMVKRGTAHLPNVTVLPTGPYLISSATFPAYFLKEREKAEQVHCLLDIEIFARYFAPRFGITHRYMGTEPLSPMTNQYNTALKENLPSKGICPVEIPRLEVGGKPISASAVRARLDRGESALSDYLPETTLSYLQTL